MSVERENDNSQLEEFESSSASSLSEDLWQNLSQRRPTYNLLHRNAEYKASLPIVDLGNCPDKGSDKTGLAPSSNGGSQQEHILPQEINSEPGASSSSYMSWPSKEDGSRHNSREGINSESNSYIARPRPSLEDYNGSRQILREGINSEQILPPSEIKIKPPGIRSGSPGTGNESGSNLPREINIKDDPLQGEAKLPVNDNGGSPSEKARNLLESILKRAEHRAPVRLLEQDHLIKLDQICTILPTGDTLTRSGDVQTLTMPNGDELRLFGGSNELTTDSGIKVLVDSSGTTHYKYPNGDSLSVRGDQLVTVVRGNKMLCFDKDTVEVQFLHPSAPSRKK